MYISTAFGFSSWINSITESKDNHIYHEDMEIGRPTTVSESLNQNFSNSMSGDYHHRQQQGIFSFSNGFERSDEQQQQIPRDKIRVPEFEQPGPPPYEAGNMLSDMFNFPSGVGTATELLENQILQSYRNSRVAPPAAEWYQQGMAVGGGVNLGISKEEPISGIFMINNHNLHHRSLPPHQSSSGEGAFGNFPWVPNSAAMQNISNEGQGLSLSLSSSFPHLDDATAASVGGGMNFLRNSKYAKAAKELLEEFCSVAANYNQSKKKKFRNPNSDLGGGTATTSVGGKDFQPLSGADKLEHQRRKVKLLSMLDEVDRRYNHYCKQMQVVMNSFDMVMGFGASAPYTCLAQKAMSCHFRTLKESIASQLKHSCGLLGESDAIGTSGITKGETPRLRLVDQSLRQQRAFHNQIGMGMMDQEAWRPQRGLPERSVNILRAWLFEHFLHPYPSDADKHLLARQTGLSKNQVSNWFINARVRLWKPMIEEMYQQEAENAADDGDDQHHHRDQDGASPTTVNTAAPPPKINAPDNDHNFTAVNNYRPQCFSDSSMSKVAQPVPAAVPDIGSTLIRFGTSAGDVSLTLGLRHAGNLPESRFSVGEFGGR